MIKILFGRYFWIWTCLFLCSASYLSAHSISNLMRLWLPTKIYTPPSAGKTAASQKKGMDVILKSRNILDGSEVTPSNKPAPVAAKAEKPKEKPKKAEKDENGCPAVEDISKLKEARIKRVRLKGTIYTPGDPSKSIAAFYTSFKVKKPKLVLSGYHYRKRMRRVEMFGVGEKLKGHLICTITRKYVVLMKRGKMTKYSLYKKKKKKGGSINYGSVGLFMPKPAADGPGEVKIDAKDQFTISRATVQNWLANPMQHAMSARIMPNYKRGRAAGFRLVWVRKKSLYSQIGLRSGDVVQQINGKNVGVSTALGLYSQLPYAKKLRVNIIRKGVRRQITYNIK